ncbi:MAG: hypothetical protein IIA88_06530, partial [Bacteroidetes bacterium]|nr:hypothetical protein [Bacteroidota bacterium]
MKKFRDFIAYNCFMICIAIVGGLGIFIFYGCKKDKSEPAPPDSNVWVQKADLGDTARSSAVGFSIGSKGYIGTGLYISEPN